MFRSISLCLPGRAVLPAVLLPAVLLPAVLLPAMMLLAMPLSAFADDWPQWAGPQRDQVWREAGIATNLPASGPPVVWKADAGAGYASPAVVGNRVYLMDRVVADQASVPDDPFQRGSIPGSERIRCFDDETGKLVWQYDYSCPYTISYPLGPRTTPVVAEGKVWSLGAEGNLYCLTAEKGDVAWSRELKKDYGIDAPMWGFSASPLLDGNKLICMVGGNGSTVVAFDANSGKEIWRALSAKEPGYCPPVIYEAGGKRQLIVWHGEAVVSLDPETGKEYWNVPLKPAYGMSVAPPVRDGDELFATSFQDASALIHLEESKPAAELVWKGTKQNSFYSTIMTPWFEDGVIYGCDSYGQFRAIKAETGERLWETLEPTGGKRERWGTAFLVKHQPTGTFFLLNEKGELITAKLSPAGYEEVSRAKVIEPTAVAGGRLVLWSAPAFAHKCMYVRNDKELVKVSLAE